MGLLSREPKYVRDAKRHALTMVRTAETSDQMDRGSAAWHRLDDASRRMRGKRVGDGTVEVPDAS